MTILVVFRDLDGKVQCNEHKDVTSIENSISGNNTLEIYNLYESREPIATYCKHNLLKIETVSI